MIKNLMIVFAIAAALCAGNRVALGQNDVLRGGMVPEYGDDAQFLWVWGPVVSIDSQKNEITLRYFDYDADQEKEMSVSVDEKTSFENIRSLAEIKTNDALSIDYIVGPDGQNIARNISVEKPEEPMVPIEDMSEPEPANTKMK